MITIQGGPTKQIWCRVADVGESLNRFLTFGTPIKVIGAFPYWGNRMRGKNRFDPLISDDVSTKRILT